MSRGGVGSRAAAVAVMAVVAKLRRQPGTRGRTSRALPHGARSEVDHRAGGGSGPTRGVRRGRSPGPARRRPGASAWEEARVLLPGRRRYRSTGPTTGQRLAVVLHRADSCGRSTCISPLRSRLRWIQVRQGAAMFPSAPPWRARSMARMSPASLPSFGRATALSAPPLISTSQPGWTCGLAPGRDRSSPGGPR